MGGTLEGGGDRCVTKGSSTRLSKGCEDLRLIKSEIGFRRPRLSRPVFLGGAVGVDKWADFEALDSLSLMPLSSELWDLEWLE